MTRNFLYLLSAFIWNLGYAQPVNIQWQKCYGSTGNNLGKVVRQTGNGSYIVGGTSQYNDGDVTGNHGFQDYWLVKIDALGGIEWQKSYGGSDDDQLLSLELSSDLGYIATGWSASTDGDVTGNHGLEDYWIVKVDSLGTIQWERSFGGSNNDLGFSVIETNDTGYVLAGWSNSTNGNVSGNHGDYDYWIIKLDNNGNLLWEKSFGGTGSDEAQAIRKTNDNGFIITGESTSSDGDITGSHGGADLWVIKLDSLGNLQWQSSRGGSGSDLGLSETLTNDGSYVFAGWSNSTDGDVTGHHGSGDYWVAKLNSAGTLQWQKCLGGSNQDYAQSVEETTDHGFIVAGYTLSSNGDVTFNHGMADYWIVKLDSMGSVEWQQSYGGMYDDKVYSIRQTTDAGYIMAGEAVSNNGDVSGNHGIQDYWVVKLDLASGITENESSDRLSIQPNPVIDKLRVEFTRESGNIRIMDLAGRQILNFNFTSREAELDISGLAPGIYFVRVNNLVKKIVKQ